MYCAFVTLFRWTTSNPPGFFKISRETYRVQSFHWPQNLVSVTINALRIFRAAGERSSAIRNPRDSLVRSNKKPDHRLRSHANNKFNIYATLARIFKPVQRGEFSFTLSQELKVSMLGLFVTVGRVVVRLPEVRFDSFVLFRVSNTSIKSE